MPVPLYAGSYDKIKMPLTDDTGRAEPQEKNSRGAIKELPTALVVLIEKVLSCVMGILYLSFPCLSNIILTSR